jgi:hypothetical protein
MPDQEAARVPAAVLVTPAGRTVVTAGLDPNDISTPPTSCGGSAPAIRARLRPFDVTTPGAGIHEIGDAGADRPFAAYAVSLEPGRTMPATPTTVVASGPVQA